MPDRGPLHRVSVLALFPLVALACSSADTAAPDTVVPSSPATTTSTSTTSTSTSSTTSTTTTTTVPEPTVLVDPASFGTPWGDAVHGLLTFRGNPTRSWYGTGWTGQPAVFERDGRTWVVFGAYDWKVHFVDAATGEDIIPPFATGDIAKGNVTVDPDGYPLVYVGSRDNYLRVIAIDGDAPRELWKLNGRTPDRVHNDDWDAAPLVVEGHLLAGGENSWFHVVRLDRGYAADGTVTVAPEVVARVPGWDDQLMRDLGNDDPRRVSLEAAVAVRGDIAWLNNSGGLVQGWDLSSLRTGVGEVHRVFRYWTGDDSDAAVVPDDEGFLFVGVEVDRNNARAREVGQLLKLDPSRPDDPVVWAVDVNHGIDSGTWGPPIVVDDVVIWSTKPGTIHGIDRDGGAVLWTLKVSGPVLSSPVLVDGVLVQGDGRGRLHAFDLSDPRTQPGELWTVELGANIESTPAVWNGRIYVGTRAGYVYAIGVPGSEP